MKHLYCPVQTGARPIIAVARLRDAGFGHALEKPFHALEKPMLDPFTAWSRMLSATCDVSRTGKRASSTMRASREVIAQRSGMIADAVRSPLTGDYAELAMMVPEKLEAFSKAGAAMATEWWSMQAAFMAEAQHLNGLLFSGRPPSIAEFNELSARGTAYAVRSVERAARFSGVGLAPVHATATANARRLKKRPRK